MNAVYQRNKTENGWRYERIKVGRGHRTGELKPPFYLRVSVGAKQQWRSLDAQSWDAAEKEVQRIKDTRNAAAKGLSVLDDGEMTNRRPVGAAIDAFLIETEKSKGKATLQVYANTLGQFSEYLKSRKVVFLDQIDREIVRGYRDFLRAGGERQKVYAPHTITNRTVTVISFLKANDIKTGFSLSKDLPKIDEQPAIPYSEDELQKLFAVMTPDEMIRFKFFLGTAAREREVMFATWQDLDFDKALFHIRPKPDAGFTIKNHEVRTVKIPKELLALLRGYRKHAPHPRWLFINQQGNPDGKMLQKLKFIAKRAGLNCGECKSVLRLGRYNKVAREVCCDEHPTCTKFYLHRFRKTCATRWSNEFVVPTRTVQYFLGHKSLATTQRYLGVANLDSIHVG